MSAEAGWVYLMVNPAIPDMVKVGATVNDPLERARQLSASTSSPMPFVLAYSRRVAFPFAVEAALHSQLDQYRVNDSREFFKVSLHRIITLVEQHGEILESNETPIDLSFSELFATFPDDGGARYLTPEECAQCRELEAL